MTIRAGKGVVHASQVETGEDPEEIRLGKRPDVPMYTRSSTLLTTSQVCGQNRDRKFSGMSACETIELF